MGGRKRKALERHQAQGDLLILGCKQYNCALKLDTSRRAGEKAQLKFGGVEMGDQQSWGSRGLHTRQR